MRLRLPSSDSGSSLNRIDQGLKALLLGLTLAEFARANDIGTLVVWGDGNPVSICSARRFSASELWGAALNENGKLVPFRGSWSLPGNLPNRIEEIAVGNGWSVGTYGGGRAFGFIQSSGSFAEILEPAGMPIASSVGVSRDRAYFLRSDGKVVQWHLSFQNPGTEVPGVDEIVSMAVGYQHVAAVRRDGTVVAWGVGWSGETNVPAGLNDVKAVAAGIGFTVALRHDGTLVAWGSAPSPPPEVTDVKAIAAGHFHLLALKNDGTVQAWGSNYRGALDVPPGLTNVISISAGPYTSMALTTNPAPIVLSEPTDLTRLEASDASFAVIAAGDCPLNYQWTFDGKDISGANGTSYGLGRPLEYSDSGHYAVRISNRHGSILSSPAELTVTDVLVHEYGSLNAGSTIKVLRPGSLGLVSAVAVGANHVVVLRRDGTVISWGSDSDGQSRPPPELDDVTMVSAGGTHTVALRRDGSVVAWGNNRSGQTSIPPDLKPCISIAAGVHHSVAIQHDGTVRAWGSQGRAESGLMRPLTNIIAVTAGQEYSAALDRGGKVFVWGNASLAKLLPPDRLANVTAISAGWYHLAALKDDGTIELWGDNQHGQCDVPAGLSNVVAIAAGGSQTMVLQRDGSVTSWGETFYANPPINKAIGIAAGIGFGIVVVRPPIYPRIMMGPMDQTVMIGSEAVMEVQVRGTPPFRYLWFKGDEVTRHTNSVLRLIAGAETAGRYSVFIENEAGGFGSPSAELAVLGIPAGKVFSWGDNSESLGRPPVSLNTVRAISGGGGFSVALKFDGSVVAWGSSARGQTKVPEGLDGVIAIDAGEYHALALRHDGTLVAWGSNDYGQTSIPEGLHDVVAIAAGRFHNLAVRRSGTVVAWGNPDRGATSVPEGLGAVAAVAAGLDHSVALRSDGSVVVWGSNDYGQTQVPDNLTDATAIAAGFHHTLALTRNGTVVGWGRNQSGQAEPPVDLAGVTAIAAGFTFSIALTHAGSVVGWGSPYSSIPPSSLRNIVAIGAGNFHSLAVEGPPSPALSLAYDSATLKLSLGLTPGWSYQFDGSSDLKTWAPTGDRFLATNGVMVREMGANLMMEYLRLRSIP